MKQLLGQDPLQFVDDLATLNTKCKLDQQQIVPFTVAALEDGVASFVRSQNPKTLADVRTAITRYSGSSIPTRAEASSPDAAIKSLCARLDQVVTQLNSISAIQSEPRQWPRRQHSNALSRQGHSNPAKNCSFCGGKFHAKLADCPARNKKCNHCGKLHHFQKVCRSKSE